MTAIAERSLGPITTDDLQGIDVPDADFAVLVSGSTVTRQRIQRLGRVLRKVDTKDCARGYVLYMRDTVEDPASREDAFSRELEALNRASWSVWLSQSATLSATFSA
jgi:predicted helicase